jgi:hypothetical protein
VERRDACVVQGHRVWIRPATKQQSRHFELAERGGEMECGVAVGPTIVHRGAFRSQHRAHHRDVADCRRIEEVQAFGRPGGQGRHVRRELRVARERRRQNGRESDGVAGVDQLLVARESRVHGQVVALA